MNGKIYCLKNPTTFEVKYIGFTRSTLNTRFSQHKHEALVKNRLSHVYNWFRSCVENYNKLPLIELLESNISLDKWEERESFWINSYSNLTNQKPGGAGVHLNTNQEGRIRSIESKKIPIIQTDLKGNFIKEWSSIIEAEKSLLGKHTGNIFRAVRDKSTALNCLWIPKESYTKEPVKVFKGKHWKPCYLYCLYTHELLKTYDTSKELSKEFQCTAATITQAVNKNLIFKDLYYVRFENNNSNPPKSKDIFLNEGKYFNNFNQLYLESTNLPNSLGYYKNIKSTFKVSNITEDIVRSLRETSR